MKHLNYIHTRSLKALRRFNYIGILFALLSLITSVLPSLLPRPWYIQALISSLAISVGYGIGLGISNVTRWLIQKEISQPKKQIAWHLILLFFPVSIMFTVIKGIIWQNEVRQLIGVKSLDTIYVLLTLIAIAIFTLLFIKIANIVSKLSKKILHFYNKKIPSRLSVLLAILTSSTIIYLAISGVLFSGFLKAADGIFGARDNTTPEGISIPTSPNKSGSVSSLIAWDKIGFQGRRFVGGGPSKEEIENYNNTSAEDPIRVYAGLSSANTAEARAELAVAELKRTNAFEKDVLIIATATGTGWLDPYVMDSLEYMHNGKTAIVSQQYSYLPSWISFLVDQDRAHEAGRVLYDAVLEEWMKQPQEQRPKLIAYGLSLGSFGAQDAFSGVNDIRRNLDGALFTGTPNEATLWRNITNNRDRGSPEWQPIYRSGQSVKFASTKEDINKIHPVENNDNPRILFLQHANDPVVWFSFDLIFNKPDWLNEPRGRAVSPQTRWYPVITFLQVGLDQAIAASAPLGEGHYYQDTAPHTWASVVPPEHWTTEKSDKLSNFLLK